MSIYCCVSCFSVCICHCLFHLSTDLELYKLITILLLFSLPYALSGSNPERDASVLLDQAITPNVTYYYGPYES